MPELNKETKNSAAVPPATKQVAKPKFVNRGGSGLLTKLPDDYKRETRLIPVADGKVNKIAKSIKHLAVDIESLVPDPMNARLHPERNLEAIKESLRQYGQMKPIVVRKATNVVVAGNGTLEAAKALGWTKLAATIEDMDEMTAIGYGLADNRTAELAKWDTEIISRLDKLLLEANSPTIGWSMDELEVLRMADWTPPAISDKPYDGKKADSLLISFTPDQYEIVGKAIDKIKEILEDNTLDQAASIETICSHWLFSLEGDKSADTKEEPGSIEDPGTAEESGESN